MKTGRASSSLDSAAKEESFSGSLERFLKNLGHASFLLNTIVVGLDAVENGHAKPAGLNVSWGPSDTKIAARSARKFAVESFIIRASESLKEYFLSISNLSNFNEITKKWDGKTTISEKIEDLSSCVLGDKDYRISIGILLVAWRNKIIHGGGGERKLIDGRRRSILLAEKDVIFEMYSHLDIEKLIDHAEKGAPTLKDTSCLISMSINFCKDIDRGLRASLANESVESLIKIYDLEKSIKKVKRETPARKLEQSIRRLFSTEAPELFNNFNDNDWIEVFSIVDNV